MTRVDALVLGAGMVGLGTALALQARGRAVALVDRKAPAEEASFGNAGLIQAEAVVPYAFPRNFSAVLGALLDRRSDARVHLASLPQMWRALLSYAAHASPGAIDRTARANVPILARVVAEHRQLVEEAGATGLWRDGGYLRLFRSEREQAAAMALSQQAQDRYGVEYSVWSRDRLMSEEPHLKDGLVGAIHHPAPARIEDPGALGKAYARLFEARGGQVVRGDASTVEKTGDGFVVRTDAGPLSAPDCVLALGAWTGAMLRRFGRRVPLFVKRGYHMHFSPSGNAVLNHLVVVEARGYVVAPNARGLRLTTGAEFAAIYAPHSPVQLARALADAQTVVPMGQRLDKEAWRGARPCLPDLLPMIGPVPGVSGLWCNFGHHHLGFTMGPATGRLLAEMMDAQVPYTDPTSYRVDRFSA